VLVLHLPADAAAAAAGAAAEARGRQVNAYGKGYVWIGPLWWELGYSARMSPRS
jgi:hypothetical protein